jgi:hypothetical protein
MAKGFVYILTNQAMPGLVKIGHTVKVPTERAAELSTTGVPAPFDVEYYCLVDEPATLEASVHSRLSDRRQNNDREFFKVNVAEAIATITSLALAVEHAWHRHATMRPRPASVECAKCGASYVSAEYCPKCRLKLTW